MKNFTIRFLLSFLVLLLSAQSLLSQTTFRAKMDAVFQNVNKSQVSTQFLKESGYTFLALDRFNGVTLADTTLVDMDNWRMLYGSLLTSYVGSSTPVIPQLKDINTTVANYDKGSSIPVSILYANYNDLRPDAITANLLTGSNQQLFDVAGRSAIPDYLKVYHLI